METLNLDLKLSEITLGELLEFLNPKPIEIIGNKALASYVGFSLKQIEKMKKDGELDGTFRQPSRKIFYNRKKIDKLFKIR